MKNIEFEQMEKVNGGNCTTSAASVVVSSAALIAIGLSTGPIGWISLGIALTASSLANYNFYSTC